MKKLLMTLFIGIFLISLASASWSNNTFNNSLTSENITLPNGFTYCYQEDANTSNQTGIDGNCGLKYTGSYANLTSDDYTNMHDGNFSTQTPMPPSRGIIVNYSIPNIAQLTGNKITMKYEDATVHTINITVPSTCMANLNTLSIWYQAYFQSTTRKIFIACLNATGYENITTVATATTNPKFYEEAMNWNVSSFSDIRYLSVPNGTYITNANLNLSSFIVPNSTAVQNETESFNNWTSADGGTEANASFAYDGNWDTYAEKNDTVAVDYHLYENYTKPFNNISNASINFKYSLTGGVDSILTVYCYGTVQNQIYQYVTGTDINALTVTTTLPADCLTPNQVRLEFWYSLSNPTGRSFRHYETNISFYGYQYATSPSLSVGSTQVWNYSGTFNQTNNQTSNFANAVNSYLGTCSYSGGYCQVPFTFSSTTAGMLQYSALNFSGGNTNISTINFTANTSNPVPENANVSFNATGTTEVSFLDTFFNWFVDGVSKSSGYAQTAFSYVFNNQASNPNSNVTLVANNSQGTITNSMMINTLSANPVVTIYYPTSNINTTTKVVNWSVTDINLDSCWYNNGTANISITCNVNFTGSFQQGLNNLTIYANDSVGNIGSASVTNFFLDSLYPQVSYISPTYANASNIFGDTIPVYINFTETNYANTTFRLSNSTDLLQNITTSSSNFSLFSNLTNLLSSNFYYNVTVCDLYGNCNTTDTRKINFYNITISSPSGLLDYGVAGLNTSLNYVITNSSPLNTCWYSYNSTNHYFTCGQNQNITLIDNAKVLTVYANDSNNNIGGQSATWDYSYYEQSGARVYPPNTLSTQAANFSLQLLLPLGAVPSDGNLIFNGTSYASTISSIANSTGPCFQETANVSTACGGLSTGAYSSTIGSNWFDGNYSTSSTLDSTNYAYVNYTIPNIGVTAANFSWDVDGNNYSTTVPAACISGSKLQIKMRNDFWSGGSFPEGKVTMADGSIKDINEIKEGDYVLSYDETTGLNVPNKVISTEKYMMPDGDYILTINDRLKLTPNHRIWINGEWQQVYNNLKIGDVLRDIDGNEIIVNKIDKDFTPVYVYALEVENAHSYYVNGIRVHNIGTLAVASGARATCFDGVNWVEITKIANTLDLYEESITWIGLNSEVVTYINTLSMPSAPGSYSFYWEINPNTTISTINISDITFALCNATNNVSFINFTFKNETLAEESVNATFDSDFEYWLGDGTTRKTYTFTNASENSMYSFCVTPSNVTMNLLADVRYKNAGSPQRTYTNQSIITNSTSVRTLFLLPLASGTYVNVVIQNIATEKLAGALVTIRKSSDGSLISSSYTDGTGTATFWLDTLSSYSVVVTKSGYNDVSTSFIPSSLTSGVLLLTMNPTSEEGGTPSFPNPVTGISYVIRPTNSIIDNGTTYNFTFDISSPSGRLDSYGFTLYNENGSSLGSAFGSTSTGEELIKALNTGVNNKIIMQWYYIVGGNTTTGNRTWIVVNPEGSDWSIKHFFDDVKAFTDTNSTGLFGIKRGTGNGDFTLAIVIFLVVLFTGGIMSYKYGLTSTTAVTGVIFALVLFFDVAVALLPNPISSIAHFPTIFMGVILFVMFIREAFY